MTLSDLDSLYQLLKASEWSVCHKTMQMLLDDSIVNDQRLCLVIYFT